MSSGVVFVAYGTAALAELELATKSLRELHDWEVVVISADAVPCEVVIRHLDTGLPGRDAKTSLDRLSPFDYTLYLDADTRVHGDVSVIFDILKDGWELVMVPSAPQQEQVFDRLQQNERTYTAGTLHNPGPLQLNTGVMGFRKTKAVRALFAQWRNEWQRFRDRDQGALMRALEYCPVKLWLLGYPFNSDTGAVISHHFGRAAGGCCGER